MKKAFLTSARVGIGIAVLCALAYKYFDPYIPITLPDATTCQVYGIESTKTVNRLGLPPFDRYRVITNGPFMCGHDILMKVQRLIAKPIVDRRYPFSGAGFDPHYAFKLTGPSGTIIVLSDYGEVAIARYNLSGKRVQGSGLIQDGSWNQLLRETHPGDPIPLPDATTCQVYGVGSSSDIIEDANARGVTPILPTKTLDQKWFIRKGPIVCSPDVLMQVKRLIASQSTYHGFESNRFRFSPRYAFRLTGSSGTVIVLLDLDPVHIQKFDVHGTLVQESEALQSHDEWIRLLKEALPEDKQVEYIWQQYERLTQ
jgi:hypothetical protein